MKNQKIIPHIYKISDDLAEKLKHIDFATLAKELVEVQPMMTETTSNVFKVRCSYNNRRSKYNPLYWICQYIIKPPFGQIIHEFLRGYTIYNGKEYIVVDDFVKQYGRIKFDKYNKLRMNRMNRTKWSNKIRMKLRNKAYDYLYEVKVNK
jgi:hypothetical protein